MNKQTLDLLLNRRSVLSKNLSEPGPNEQQLQTLLKIATRVPDHRKLEPWRFIIIQGDKRKELGQKFCQIRQLECELTPAQITAEQNRYNHAPLVIVVVFSPVEHKTPVFEQLLSCGAVCQHINLAATALGFSSQWVTNWCSFNKKAQAELGLKPHESIAGFIHVGTANCIPNDRQRPDLSKKVSRYT
ncbi:MAG TPA: nitroreductase [Oceanospirillales bacterium]|nr:nitroreductase [Oceanospirillales bacterium]